MEEVNLMLGTNITHYRAYKRIASSVCVTWNPLFIGETVSFDQVAYKHIPRENQVKNHSDAVKIMRRNIHKIKEDE